MARIRSIKPEFPQSETIGRLSRDARLLFIQLWTLVDDSGRTRAASRMLASLLYPYDDDAPQLMEGWLSELERENCIIRYVVDGSVYLQIANWLKHQKIDRPSASKFPAFDEASRGLASDSRNVAQDQDQGRDQGEDQESPPTAPPEGGATTGAQDAKRGTRLPDDWQPSAGDCAFATELGVDVGAVADEFADYWRAVPGARGRKLDWEATFRNRCREVASRGQRRTNRNGSDDGPGPLMRTAARVAARMAARAQLRE